MHTMPSSRKAQGAVEFLTTYGWAFLLLLVVMGALFYFNVFNPTKALPDKCTFGQTWYCRDYTIIGNNPKPVVGFLLSQSGGKTLFLQRVSVVSKDLGVSVNNCTVNGVELGGGNAEVQMEVGTLITVTCNLTGPPDPQRTSDFIGNKEGANLKVYYRELRSSLQHVEDGDFLVTVQQP